MEKRETFSGKLGFILACLGSAIGLGNIWMFPWRLGQFGGAAFLIPYFICVFILGTTGLMIEFSFGRSRRCGSLKGIQDTFNERNKPFGKILSIIPTLAVGSTLVFYSVVVGWIFKYFFMSVNKEIYNTNISKFFDTFAGTSSSIPWHLLALTLTVIIVLLGITKGIEKANKILMPGLFIVFVILLIRSVTLKGSIAGLKYLLLPHWSFLFKPMTWIMALGQAFFTVSLNGAGMVVYGSYLKDKEDIPSAAFNVAIFDTISALLAAFIIMPAVFSFGLDPTSGPSLLFITMPHIFNAMPLGYIFGILFFLSIIFAGISSAMNMLEAPSEALISKFKFKRVFAVLIVAIIAFFIGIPLDLSMARFGHWADFVTIYLAPIGSIIASITFMWVYGFDNALKDINKGSKKPIGNWFKPLSYLFILSAILVLILGIIYNGIG
ncbi:sodium-dependent tryptophan transporter [Clostridium novyi B str. ATCC 27606]|uniref:Sodium-dependent tryptophan transporter n=2 Tax=Clostridium TaxID=1485 RepID=A0AA40IT97_CLONO|nr:MULTISPECIES: sodium-dependent transporter [Clostridium]KEI11934.1 sodium-dependent tryptophan transporter [Clostridium novyi B str. NCTC 9691]KEI13474.1 sodium-dependent tryptophan transporter [Clostridium novyi B str. ATCC 27606]KEI17932.1 sodium-dependent tryptophan transporter [Clostridium haemolyticum NCTC 9693]KGN01565.1 sodium-dependent tryptophan transporter [Clostridium haemolyticum NCTC 8350]OOB75269.1 sodium-dependent tryptophan transporter [Clostridium haemolyticum]